MDDTAGSGIEARLRRVLRHIDDHLDEDLGVAALARVAALSPHHFHRRFTASVGVGVLRYVRLLRLKRASYRLAFREAGPVLDLALDSAYGGPEAFARAFRRLTGQAPSEFRKGPRWKRLQEALRPAAEARRIQARGDEMGRHEVEVVECEEVRVAVLEHRGDPDLLMESVRRFVEWRRAAGLHPRVGATFNVLHGDPETTPPDDFRLELCAATDREVAPNGAGVVAGLIPGGRCARLRHVGPEEGLREAIAHLLGRWMPESGEARRDFPVYLRRVRFFPDVPEHEAVTEVFLPLRPPQSPQSSSAGAGAPSESPTAMRQRTPSGS